MPAFPSDSRQPDVIIVGGGSAGAVLAARLSADGARRVLLLEAGPAYSPTDYPDSLRRQEVVGGDEAHDWGFKSEVGEYMQSLSLPRGKVLGGTSAINGAVAMRTPRHDHERWVAKHALPEMAWEGALAAYRSLERTSFGADGDFGRDGPFPVHQLGEEEISDPQRAFVTTALAAGYPASPGFSTSAPLGVGPTVMNARMGVRLNTGMTLLSDDVRARPNLTIQAATQVDTIVFDGPRATGVRLVDGEMVHADEVILSAGTYASAAILLRSGVGPAADLTVLDIPVIADLAVGRRLQDHPMFPIVYAMRPERVGLAFPPIGAALWTHSRWSGGQEADLSITTVPLPDPSSSPTGSAFALAVALVRPNSVGSLKLRSRDVKVPPIIDLAFLTDRADRMRMVDGVEMAREIARQQPFAAAVESEMAPGPNVSDRAAIEAALPSMLTTYHHPTSTIPMGSADDLEAVVDAVGRVRGVLGLRVIDASIWPDVPSVATGFPTMMLAERIAATIVAAR